RCGLSRLSTDRLGIVLATTVLQGGKLSFQLTTAAGFGAAPVLLSLQRLFACGPQRLVLVTVVLVGGGLSPAVLVVLVAGGLIPVAPVVGGLVGSVASHDGPYGAAADDSQRRQPGDRVDRQNLVHWVSRCGSVIAHCGRVCQVSVLIQQPQRGFSVGCLTDDNVRHEPGRGRPDIPVIVGVPCAATPTSNST